MKKVILYTDGACSGNPGPGGYAAILIYNNIEFKFDNKQIHFIFYNIWIFGLVIFRPLDL